jgi:hypothetical protein
MLSQDDIVRRVRTVRFSSKQARNGRKTYSMYRLAVLAQLHRATLYNVAATGRMSAETADKLRSALSMIGAIT